MHHFQGKSNDELNSEIKEQMQPAIKKENYFTLISFFFIVRIFFVISGLDDSGKFLACGYDRLDGVVERKLRTYPA